MKYRGILFDKDGTLLDFNKTWLPTYLVAAREMAAGDDGLARQLLEDHGFDAEQQRFAGGSLLAAGNNHDIAIAWSAQMNQPQQLDRISSRLNQIFRVEAARQATPVNGLVTALEEFKRTGYKLGVATADSYQGIIDTLASFHVLEHFDFLAGYDSGHGVKPEAGMVDAFCREMQLAVKSVVVVGDNRHDIEMGRNAGAGLCVGVLTGTSRREDLADIADFVIDDISQLPGLV